MINMKIQGGALGYPVNTAHNISSRTLTNIKRTR